MTRPTPQAFIADLQGRLGELLRNSPAGDLERNLRATLGQAFQRLDLVTRDEFDAQLERLARLQERVAHLEEALARSERPGGSAVAAQGSATADELLRAQAGWPGSEAQPAPAQDERAPGQQEQAEDGGPLSRRDPEV